MAAHRTKTLEEMKALRKVMMDRGLWLDMAKVCKERFWVEPIDVLGNKQARSVILARQWCWEWLREYGMPLWEIAELWGVPESTIRQSFSRQKERQQ